MKPIIFSTEMVKAILDGRKTQTRRVINPQPKEGARGSWYTIVKGHHYFITNEPFENQDGSILHPWDRRQFIDRCSKYRPGDILWVRETWNGDWCDHYTYKADGGSAVAAGYAKEPRWYPSIHMPREAARIFLRVTGVRVERVQDISEKDAIADGCVGVTGYDAYGEPIYWIEEPGEQYANLWNTINEKRGYGWNTNPWVWVYEFERISKEAADGQD